MIPCTNGPSLPDLKGRIAAAASLEDLLTGGLVEIRVERGPTSVVGFVASLKKPVPINLRDVYDGAARTRIHPRLAFDDSWDKKEAAGTGGQGALYVRLHERRPH